MKETKTLPIIEGEITIDPKDPEVIKILSMLCLSCGPIAHIFQRAGYPIPTHAEEEQAHVMAWCLALYKQHGTEWRKVGDEQLKELNTATP
jgi:hypothetical protein